MSWVSFFFSCDGGCRVGCWWLWWRCCVVAVVVVGTGDEVAVRVMTGVEWGGSWSEWYRFGLVMARDGQRGGRLGGSYGREQGLLAGGWVGWRRRVCWWCGSNGGGDGWAAGLGRGVLLLVLVVVVRSEEAAGVVVVVVRKAAEAARGFVETGLGDQGGGDCWLG